MAWVPGRPCRPPFIRRWAVSWVWSPGSPITSRLSSWRGAEYFWRSPPPPPREWLGLGSTRCAHAPPARGPMCSWFAEETPGCCGIPPRGTGQLRPGSAACWLLMARAQGRRFSGRSPTCCTGEPRNDAGRRGRSTGADLLLRRRQQVHGRDRMLMRPELSAHRLQPRTNAIDEPSALWQPTSSGCVFKEPDESAPLPATTVKASGLPHPSAPGPATDHS